MKCVQVNAATVIGTRAFGVAVEATVGNGRPRLEVVGLSSETARELRVRVRSALGQVGLDVGSADVVIHVVPAAEFRKAASLDLAVAVALYAAMTDDLSPLPDALWFGELSLDGRLRHGRGLIPQLIHARERGRAMAVVPSCQLGEAKIVDGLEVYGAETLGDVIRYLRGSGSLSSAGEVAVPSRNTPQALPAIPGFEREKRALEIAAAGGHDVLLIGPSGAGKTMLARRVVEWMPPLTEEEALEVASIQSAAGLGLVYPVRRPFRAPHHTASAAALLGGGDPVCPGELTLAHHGVLLLDDLPEFQQRVLEPVILAMQGSEVTVIRRGGSATMPAKTLVVGAMSPCPCAGRWKHISSVHCTCAPDRMAAYRARAPVETFDMHVFVGMEPEEHLSGPPDEAALRVASTIARLDGRTRPNEADVAQAMSYRVSWPKRIAKRRSSCASS